MKAALVMSQDYFDRLDLSALVVSEFGDRIARDDVLCDVVTKERFVVGERGFTPRVSEQTADRLTWSRESSISVKGKCGNAVGRIWASPDHASCWHRLSLSVTARQGKWPIAVPLTGSVRNGISDVPALASCDEDGSVEAVTSLVCNVGDPLVFYHESKAGIVEARLMVKSILDLAQSGALVSWSNEDAATELV